MVECVPRLGRATDDGDRAFGCVDGFDPSAGVVPLVVEINDRIGNLGGAGLLEQRKVSGSEAHLLTKEAWPDRSLVLELTDKMVALVKRLGARRTLTADPELLGATAGGGGRRRPAAVGGHREGGKRLPTVEDDRCTRRGLISDGGIGFARIFAREADFFGETVGAGGERHLDRLRERVRQFANREACTVERGERAVRVRRVRLGQFARPVVVAVWGDVEFERPSQGAGEAGAEPGRDGEKSHRKEDNAPSGVVPSNPFCQVEARFTGEGSHRGILGRHFRS